MEGQVVCQAPIPMMEQLEAVLVELEGLQQMRIQQTVTAIYIDLLMMEHLVLEVVRKQMEIQPKVGMAGYGSRMKKIHND
jgi:hypothetical protein